MGVRGLRYREMFGVGAVVIVNSQFHTNNFFPHGKKIFTIFKNIFLVAQQNEEYDNECELRYLQSCLSI